MDGLKPVPFKASAKTDSAKQVLKTDSDSAKKDEYSRHDAVE
jgi:hypothetical protein